MSTHKRQPDTVSPTTLPYPTEHRSNRILLMFRNLLLPVFFIGIGTLAGIFWSTFPALTKVSSLDISDTFALDFSTYGQESRTDIKKTIREGQATEPNPSTQSPGFETVTSNKTVFQDRLSGLKKTLHDQYNRSQTEKSQIRLLRQQIEQDISAIKHTSNQLVSSDNPDSPAVVDQLSRLNEAFNEAQTKTFDARALVVSLQTAIAAGNSLQPFLQRLSPESLQLQVASTTAEKITVAKPDIRPNLSRAGSPAAKSQQQSDLGPKLLEFAKNRLRLVSAHEESLRQLVESIKTEAALLDQQRNQIETIEFQFKDMSAKSDALFDRLLNSISELDLEIPSKPFASVKTKSTSFGPRILLVEILFALVGFLGVYAAISFSSVPRGLSAHLQRKSGLTLLAGILPQKPLPGSGLDSIASFARQDDLETRPFRSLQSSITQLPFEAHRLIVTSAGRGDGKTTTVTNLAVSFAQAGQRTLLIDADLLNQGTTHKLELQGSRGLTQILRDEKPVAQSCLENVFNLGIENLDVLPAGMLLEAPAEVISNERWKQLIAWADSNYDRILFDTPSLLTNKDIRSISQYSDGALLVVRPDKSRRKAVLQTIELCRTSGIPVIGFVTNQITDRSTKRSSHDASPPATNIAHAPESTETEFKPRLAA